MYQNVTLPVAPCGRRTCEADDIREAMAQLTSVIDNAESTMSITSGRCAEEATRDEMRRRQMPGYNVYVVGYELRWLPGSVMTVWLVGKVLGRTRSHRGTRDS